MTATMTSRCSDPLRAHRWCCFYGRATMLMVVMTALVLVLVFGVPRALAQTCFQSAVSMRFKPLSAGPPFSFITQDWYQAVNATTTGLSGSSASVSVPSLQIMRSRYVPPIIIQILDSNGDVDTSDSANDVTIQVSSSTTTLSAVGASAPVKYGEAHITQLVIVGTETLYHLTFTAVSSSPLLPVVSNAASRQMKLFNITGLSSLTPVFRLQFAQNRTRVMYPGQPLTIVFGQTVPMISLLVVTSQYLRYPTSNTLGSNYSVVATLSADATASSVSIAAGGAVPVTDGEATFDALVITGPTLASPMTFSSITFTLWDASNPTSLSAATGLVTVLVASVPNSAMAFERRDSSFVSSEGESAIVTAGVPLPPIRISLRGTMLERSADTSGLIITATAKVPYALKGARVGVVNGIATFASLTFDSRISGNVVLQFTAGTQGTLPVAGTVIRTGWMVVAPSVLPAVRLQFLPNSFSSFLTYPGQKADVVLFATMSPIRLQVLDSTSTLDTSTVVTVTASATAGVQFTATPSVVTTTSGQATFSSLMFTSTSSSVFPRLTFTASTTNSSLLVGGSSVVSGILTIAATQPNYNLRFQPYGASLFPAAGIDSVATVGIAMPRIVIELTTSAGALDSSSSAIGITASAPGATLSGSFLRVSAGVAIFDALTFASETAGTFIITFTAGSEVPDAAVAGKSITTGNIRVATSLTPAFHIRFSTIVGMSYILYPGHVMPVTGSVTMPRVVIELIDSAHNLSTSSSPLGIKLSFSSDATLSSPSRKTVTMAAGSSSVSFVAGTSSASTGITISQASAPVLTFTVVDTKEAAFGVSIATGSLAFVPVASRSGYAAITIQAGSTVAGPLATASVATTASMYFSIQLLDSTGSASTSSQLSTSTTVTVTVSSSVPLRAPVSVTIGPSGVGVFSALQFASSTALSKSTALILTFTASVAPTQPSAILPVCTGALAIIGPSAEAGIDVVAQILRDFSSFSASSWIALLARRLNVESSRFLVTRAYYGTSADPMSGVTATFTSTGEVNKTANAVAVWYGTRLDFRILEPQPTSRNTKPAWAVADAFLHIETRCSAAPELYLRKSMNLSADTSCDWFLFDDQFSGAQQCAIASGTDGYCSCFSALIGTLGMRCLGYASMTDLCLNTLLGDAGCTQSSIVSVCSLLQASDVSRVGVFATGIFFLFLLAPLVYLKLGGFFTKLQRPTAHEPLTRPVEKINLDETELL